MERVNIVERLRACHGIHSGDPECCCEDAAAEIERLEELLWQEAGNRVEIERLQELLRGVGANRYWEGRWRDEAAENERLRAALRAIGDDPEAGVNIALYVKAALGSNA
jgi:hypothetical protein